MSYGVGLGKEPIRLPETVIETPAPRAPRPGVFDLITGQARAQVDAPVRTLAQRLRTPLVLAAAGLGLVAILRLATKPSRRKAKKPRRQRRRVRITKTFY